MTTETVDGHAGATVTIDVCERCQVFWFDARENLQVSPGGILRLFRIIGSQRSDSRPAVAARPGCPRCAGRLLLTHDRQRNTAFRYMRCPKGHGRLITFLDFLREKDFVRPLSPAQIAELRQSVQTISCSNCGAPVDLARDTACAHCASPLSMLDMKQAAHLVEQLRAASQPQAVDPALPLRLEQARREVERGFDSTGSSAWADDVSTSGLVNAGLRALLKLAEEL